MASEIDSKITPNPEDEQENTSKEDGKATGSSTEVNSETSSVCNESPEEVKTGDDNKIQQNSKPNRAKPNRDVKIAIVGKSGTGKPPSFTIFLTRRMK